MSNDVIVSVEPNSVGRAVTMTIRVAINGYGRIGRNILRACFEASRHDIQIVAINDLGDADIHAYLTQYDTTHGRFKYEVGLDRDHLIIENQRIPIYSERDPSLLPWAALGVDIVLECTGVFKTKEKAVSHLSAGAKKVIISAPGGGDIDATIVYGVNHEILRQEHQVISNASCTTNCLAPMALALNNTVGIKSGLMTTIHAFTNDQALTDVYHSDKRRARSATQSMIPTKTGAAAAVGLVLPELNGKLDGFAIRVPTINVSLVDLSFVANQNTSEAEINEIMKSAADGQILTYNDQPLVSIDYNHHSGSSNFDATMTRVNNGCLVKVCAWYDNEWAFCCRMLDTAVALFQAK